MPDRLPVNALSSLAPLSPSLLGQAYSGAVQTPSASVAATTAPGASAEGSSESVRSVEEGAEAAAPSDRSRQSGIAVEVDSSETPAGGLSEAELKQLAELKARDREVRAHEAAHQAVGGQYAGAMSFTYQRGPDGAQYAVGGEVPIDVAPVQGDPQATIEKMRVVRAAALAPAQPSAQDRAVAAQAMQTMLQAQAELAVADADPAAQDARPSISTYA